MAAVAAASQPQLVLRSFAIYNPTLSRGNEERALDNIIFYHPSGDDNNKKMNRVGFCVACSCICERFALRNDHLEFADEIQTDGSATVLFSPQREVWLALEVDPSVDTLAMRILLEKSAAAFLMLHGADAFVLAAPPHKRYVKGSDEEYERLMAVTPQRRRAIESYFGDVVAFLVTHALIRGVNLGANNYEFRARAAADSLFAMPTVVPSFDAGIFLRLDTVCSAFASAALLSSDEIRSHLLGKTALRRSGNAMSASLQIVIGFIDACQLIYSSAPEYISHRLLFLARTQLRRLEQTYRGQVTTIYHQDGSGRALAQPMILSHRLGFVVFVLGEAVDAADCSEGILVSSSAASLQRIVTERSALLTDLFVCVDLLSTQTVERATELRMTMLSNDAAKFTEAIMSKGPGHPDLPWVDVLRSSQSSPIGIAATASVFSPSPVALLTCIPEGPIEYVARSPRLLLYPASPEQSPLVRCSDVQPSIVCYNRGFSYGTPLACLPRSAQISVAHYMAELWRSHYASSPFAVRDCQLTPCGESGAAHTHTFTCFNSDNQHYRHKLLDTYDCMRFPGRVSVMTGTKADGVVGPSMPTLLVDGHKDVAEVWLPILVNSAVDAKSGSPASVVDEVGVALLAIAQFNARVVAIYFPPKNRQLIAEQMATAANLFRAAFRGSGFI